MNPMESNLEEELLENEVCVDRISDLPDEILGKIISLLPIKNAVAASILSKRWINLCPSDILPIQLDLDDTLLLHREKNEPNNPPSVSFVDSVDKLLNITLCDVPCVEYINLSCQKDYGDAKIMSWVCAALRLNVRQLSLACSLKEAYSLFAALNGCTTLVKLVLVLDSELCHPEIFCLPNLKILHLLKLTLIDDDMYDLIEGCPALEDLCMMGCNLSDLDDLFIKSPRLKKLRIEDCFADNICEFHLNAPNLEVLILNDYVAWHYSVVKFKSPIMAHINVGPSQKQVDEAHDEYCYEDDGSWRFDNCVAELVTACSNTTSLYLAACSIVALCDSSSQLPNFQNLTSLSLGQIGLDGWALLARLLQNAPNLENLCIEGFTENEEGFANFQESLPVVPICLELHMKRIEFLQFEGDEEDMKLVGYFLNNGGVLQKLILYWPPPDNISIGTRLLVLQKQYKNCQIECRLR